MILLPVLLLAAASAIPSTGADPPSMRAFDQLATSLMQKYHLPGGAIAVMKDGKLVFARGYGYANRDTRELVQPNSAFRIASLTKPITAAAILKLAEQGKLDLDAKAFDLSGIPPFAGEHPNPQLAKITVRQLLWHAGGWDSDKSFDPMFRSLQISAATHTTPPPRQRVIARYMLTQPLQFTPGTQYAYSNFGYLLLGQIIEKVTGAKYEEWVQKIVLPPPAGDCMGIGTTLYPRRGEVRYYDYPGAPLATSVFGSGANVPEPYGGFYLEAMESHGAWVASTIDYLRFVAALDGGRILSRRSIDTMLARPPIPSWAGQSSWYGMGWMVRPAGGSANWWHAGSLPGTTTLVVRASNGWAWAAFFNSRPKDGNLAGDLDSGMWDALAKVTRVPPVDLFPRFSCYNAGQ